MNILLGIAIYIAISFLISGCAGPEPGSPEAAALKLEYEIEQKQETVETTLDTAPEWFFEVPVSENAIYTAGTSTSPDLQLAIDKGLLNAKRSLADRLNSLISAKTKLFKKETGQYEQTTTVKEGEQATINLISEVNVAGYTATKIIALKQNTQYRTFVLLEYPIGKLNRVQLETLRQQQDRESAASAKDAFKELEKDIKKGT